MANTRMDRFGNETALVGVKRKGNFGVGYFQFGNQLFKVDLSDSKKDGVESWLKITKLKGRGSSMSFNNRY